MKRIAMVLVTACLSFTALAGPANEATESAKKHQDPKQCLKELQIKQETENDEIDKDKEEKKEAGVLDKIAKKHKLGSLHFQDIIELFY